MEQVRVIKEMREADAKRGRTDQLIRPRYMVWENVPGAFSSNKGKDFAAVLEETIRIIEPEIPCIEVPEHGWPTWGGYRDLAGRWSVAWRVLDAQYWGVPQRRRRIALVADFGGDTAHKILFNSKGVSGDSEESGTEKKTTARETETGVGDSGDGVTCYGICSVDSNSMKSKNPNSGFYEAETSRCLDANGGNPTCNQGGIAVVAYCIQGNAIDRADTAGCNGKGWTEGVSYTLNTIDRPAVAVTFSKDAHGQYAENDVSATSTANHDGGAKR